MPIDIIKVLVPGATAFFVGIALAPFLTFYLYKYKAWKKKVSKTALDGTKAVEFEKIRTEQYPGTETRTPRMGGVVIWGSVLVTTVGLSLLALIFESATIQSLDFVSRSQTWIPLVTLIAGSLVGLANDILDVRSKEGEKGISIFWRLLFVGLLSAFVGWWFYAKLDVISIGIPFGGELYLGWFVIIFFVLLTLFLYASGVIDGIDGLSGGVFASIFAAYAFIAFNQSQYDLAAFSATVVGGILAFLWFNVPPARFWMTETGSMGLTITIATVAFMTDTLGEGRGISALPIIAFLLIATVLSNILQVLSKKFRGGKKIFRIAPLHHHFEAIGWPGYKVTMRYWILSIILAIIGVTFALVS